MNSSTATKIWLGVGGLLGGLLIGLGIIWVRGWYAPAGEKSLQAAQKAYAEGRQLLDKEEYQPAVQKLDEAQLLASKAMEELDARGQAAKSDADIQKVVPLQGEALWVKAVALRDKFYAAKGAAGEPIPATLDTSTGQKFRSVLRVSDIKVLNEAIRCQREAARRLPKREDVLLDTLRTEVSLPNPDWGQIENLARATLEINPKDTRSLYLAARIEVEQPRSDGKGPPVPTPEAKRNRERLLKAREYLTGPGAEEIPPFRKLHLEAQIANLLHDQFVKARKAKEAEKEDQALAKLVLDPQESALVVALGKVKDFKTLSAWDFDGIIGMHGLALERSIENLTTATTDPAPALAVLGRLLKFGATQAGEGGNRTALQKTAQAAVDGAARLQPFYESRQVPEWRQTLDEVQKLAREAQDRKVGTAALYSNLSKLLGREAVLEGQRGNKERQDELKDQAKKWLDEGLKSSQDEKIGPGRLDLLALAAERAALAGDRTEAGKHLAEMRKVEAPTAAATVALLEALLFEREGKLDRARQELEKVLAAPAPGLQLRAHLLLAQLYRTLNQPEKALASLLYIDRVAQGFASLPEVERTWAQQFHVNPDSLAAQLVLAHLGTARVKLSRHLQANGGKPDGVLALLRPHEEPAERYLARVPKKTDLERVARQDWITYLAQTGRLEQARKDIVALRADFPASVDLLRTEVALLLVPAPGTKSPVKPEPKTRDAADKLIDQFLALNPTLEAGRLFRAQWLTRTDRAAQAVKELQDKANFPKDSPAQQQVLAAALLASGQKKEGLAVLQHLPESAGLDALLIRLADTQDEKTTRLDAALKRYERNGLLICWDGERRLKEGKHIEAIARYREAIEMTAVRPLAEQGLRAALFELAQRDPKAAREQAAKLATELPQEPLPLLAAAYAALVLGDLGTDTDTWPKAQSTTAALNGWEARMNALGADKVAIALTRSEFAALTNNVVQGRADIERALALAPTNAGALLRGVNFALAQPTPVALDRADKYLATLAGVQSDSPGTVFAIGRVAEARGQLADAAAEYRKVLEKVPDDAQANQRLVVVLDKQKALDKIPAVLDAWTKAAPASVTPKLLRVCFLAKLGKGAEAVEAGRKLVEEETAAAEKKTAGSGKVVNQNGRLEVGRQLTAGGARAEAEKWVGELLAEVPDSLGARLLLGDILMQQKKYPEACDLYRKILEKHPANLIAANNLAYMLAVDLGKPEEADKVIRAIRLNKFTGQMIPGDRLDPAFLDTVGLVYQKLNQPERLPEMRTLFEPAVARYPEDARLGWHLAYALAGLKENDKARELLDRADKLAADGVGSLTADERASVRKGIELVRKSLP